LHYIKIRVILQLKKRKEVVMMDIAHTWTERLGDEDLEFARQFIMASGSLKEMASRYGVSYPTIRLRLDRLIQKIESVREDDDAFVSLVKGMAIDDRMDFETARQIIDAHRQLMGEKEG
jgi:hypothetical protein